MSTEPGLGALVSPSPRGWIVCQSLISPAPPLSPPQPPPSAHSCEGSRQPSLEAQGACSWQWSRCGTAPGNEIPLSTPCAPHEERGPPALPALTLAVPSVSLTLPVPSPFSSTAGGWPQGLPPAGSLERENPLAPPPPCRGRGAGQREVGGPGRGVTSSGHRLLCFCSSCQQIVIWPFPNSPEGIMQAMCQKADLSLCIL